MSRPVMDHAMLMRALDAYAAEYPKPHVTELVKQWADERDHRETWTHIACMIVALRAALGDPVMWPEDERKARAAEIRGGER